MMNERDMEHRMAEIEAREQAVAAKERAISAKSIRCNLYDRITLSKASIDVIIIACAAAILGCILFGVLYK